MTSQNAPRMLIVCFVSSWKTQTACHGFIQLPLSIQSDGPSSTRRRLTMVDRRRKRQCDGWRGGLNVGSEVSVGALSIAGGCGLAAG